MSQIEEIHFGWLLFNCPYPECEVNILVHKNEVNCKIFRCHALLAPHASYEECQKFKDQNMGCCQPFELDMEKMIAKCCEYK
jgi:hypothetical protein